MSRPDVCVKVYVLALLLRKLKKEHNHSGCFDRPNPFGACSSEVLGMCIQVCQERTVDVFERMCIALGGHNMVCIKLFDALSTILKDFADVLRDIRDLTPADLNCGDAQPVEDHS